MSYTTAQITGAAQASRCSIATMYRRLAKGLTLADATYIKGSKGGATPEARAWRDAIQRCHNPGNASYKDYGARGISVCARWDDFEAFFADMGERPAGLTLDRIDNDGDYGPDNCRWATIHTQANNKQSNRRITIGKETKTLQEWCSIFGVEHSKVRYRLSHGWPAKEAFDSGDFRQCQR